MAHSIMSCPHCRTAMFPPLIFALSVLAGCISFERYGTGDINADERIRAAASEIDIQSRAAALKLQSSAGGHVDQDLALFLRRHFEKANELVLAHFTRLNTILGRNFASFNPYVDKRSTILGETLELEATVALVESPLASALAFPHGAVFLTRPLVEAFRWSSDGYDPALLGVLIHELIHIRDGHALEQWATADGRNELLRNQTLGALANLTILIPFLSIRNEFDYGTTFESNDNLRKLSEFAADLGAYTLLRNDGFPAGEYVSFLSEVGAYGRTLDHTQNEPFTWMIERLKCLDILESPAIPRMLPSVVIGDEEDDITQIRDMGEVYRALDLIEDADRLREYVASESGLAGEELNREVVDVRRKALYQFRLVAFEICAIAASFPEVPLRDRAIIVPSFDLLLFDQYMFQDNGL